MAKSSINFQRVSVHSFKHNAREEEKQAKTVFTEHTYENECSASAATAKQMFDNLYKKAISKVTGRTRRAKKENCLVEAVVNLNAQHTLEDVEKLAKKVEEETGFTAIQIAVHKDEGQEQDGKLIRKNHHAHISFFTLDLDTGRQMFRREHITREKLSKLQDITSQTLKMERGKRNSKAKRLNHKEYKTVAKELAKQKDLKEEIKKLREKLKEQKAVRENYARLEQLNRELKEKIKNKDLSFEELQEELLNFKEENKKLKVENTLFKNKLFKLEKENKELKEENKKLKEEIKELKEQLKIQKNMRERQATRKELKEKERELGKQNIITIIENMKKIALEKDDFYLNTALYLYVHNNKPINLKDLDKEEIEILKSSFSDFVDFKDDYIEIKADKEDLKDLFYKRVYEIENKEEVDNVFRRRY